MPILNAVAPPKPGVAGLKLVEHANGAIYLHWQDEDGVVSPTYAMTFQLDPDGSGIRGIVYNDPPPQFKKAADGFFAVIHP